MRRIYILTDPDFLSFSSRCDIFENDHDVALAVQSKRSGHIVDFQMEEIVAIDPRTNAEDFVGFLVDCDDEFNVISPSSLPIEFKQKIKNWCPGNL